MQGKSIPIFLLLLIISGNVWAQKKDVTLSSPYHTIDTHLTYLQPNNYQPKLAAKSLNAKGLSQSEKERRAIQLIQFLDGKGLFVDMGVVPKDENFYDSTARKYRYVLFEEYPEIYVEKVGDQWLYSATTVAQIPKLHKRIYPYGLHNLLDLLPHTTSERCLGLALWQYIGLLLLFIIGFILHKLLFFIVRNTISRFIISWGKKSLAQQLIFPTARPTSLLIVSYLMLQLVPILQLPAIFSKYILLGLRISICVYVMLILYRLVDFLGIYMMRAAEKTEGNLDDQLVPLLERSLKVFVIIGGVVAVLGVLQFNVTALLTGISIGGLAFALAAQDTIKNLFGSVTIFIDKPFQVGDWITCDQIDGTVEEVGFRSTRVRTFHNSVVYIPNGKLADMTIDNMGARRYRRYSTRIGVTYSTTPHQLEQFVTALKEMVETREDTWKGNYHIYVNSFGASAIEILFYIFFKAPDWGRELKSRQEVMLEVMRIAERTGVEFAFPTQTLHLKGIPEEMGSFKAEEPN